MSSWNAKPLADVCERITDGSHRTPPFTEEGYPFATVAHVDADGKIDLTSCKRISSSDFEELKQNDCRPLPGDVLFSKDGTVGKVAVIDFDADFIVLSSLAILRPKREVLSQRFLAYALRSEPVLGEAINRKSGSAIRRIVLRDLRQVSIPIPPLPEQERLVNLLDEADELRKLRAQADRRTADLIPALFYEMFGDPRSSFKDCPTGKLGAVTTFITSGSRGWARYYSETGARFIRVQNLEGHHLSFENIAHVNPPDTAETRRTRVRANDLLLAITGNTIGLSALAPDDVGDTYVSQHVAIIRMNQRVDSSYVASFMALPTGGQQQIAKMQYGHTKPGISLQQIREMDMPLPPLSLQKEFAARVSEVRAMQAEQVASRRRLDDLFQSMLHRAFQGEL